LELCNELLLRWQVEVVTWSTRHCVFIRASLQQIIASIFKTYRLRLSQVLNPRDILSHSRNVPLEHCKRWRWMHIEPVASPRVRTSVCREEAADSAERARRLILRDMPGWRLEVAQDRGCGGRHGADPRGITAAASRAVLWGLERDHDVQL
jgi:hypothetical protein